MSGLPAYNYVRGILKGVFPAEYKLLKCKGLLRYELTNILELLEPMISGVHDQDHYLRAEVTALIIDYLQQEEFLLLLNRKRGPSL